MRPDVRKLLPTLHGEWENCTACALGKTRQDRGGSFVPGTGRPGGLMFIADRLTADDEENGVPFSGEDGLPLRGVLERLNIKDYYLTSIVACRSCTLQTTDTGEPLLRKNFRTKRMDLVYRDELPTAAEYGACRARLLEEIYLVDPTVIVGLGGQVYEALTGRPMTIARDHGKPVQIEIPGASWSPKLTDKKQDWSRKTKDGLVTPVEQNTVRYYFLPTFAPHYVRRYLSDHGVDSAFSVFANDIRTALRTHEAYLALQQKKPLVSPQQGHNEDDLLALQMEQESLE